MRSDFKYWPVSLPVFRALRLVLFKAMPATKLDSLLIESKEHKIEEILKIWFILEQSTPPLFSLEDLHLPMLHMQHAPHLYG